MRSVVLVPRRADEGPRDRLWRWTRAWWREHLPELEIYEGHHQTGLFNRSAACNAAARAAGRWDVALIIDADVICHPPNARAALEIAATTRDHLVLPFDRRHNLNERGSRRIMEGYAGSWRTFIAKTYTDMCSSAIAVPRQLWDQVGGFDEQFRGWGFEDNAFDAACQTFGRPLERVAGELWHLWHPTAPEGKVGTPSHQANRARAELYRRALGDRETTARLVAGETPEITHTRAHTNIPRIFHRTVPATTNAQVEAWWRQLQELHPGWTFRTYRDPLEAADWPMTSPEWRRVRTGAQLADMIRLEALYREGGIYVDSDVEPYRSFEPLLELRAFAAYEDAKVVPNAVLGAEPGHPAIKAVLEESLRRLRVDGRKNTPEKSTWHTGTGVTTALLPGRDDILLLPPGAFYPYHYSEKQRAGDDHRTTQPWAFCAHHWAGSWLARNAA